MSRAGVGNATRLATGNVSFEFVVVGRVIGLQLYVGVISINAFFPIGGEGGPKTAAVISDVAAGCRDIVVITG